MVISLTVVLLSFICVYFFVYSLSSYEKNTTTTINIQRDCKKIFYLDFILNASSSLLCYASFALSVLYFLLTTHTHAHSLHTPYADEKNEREREKKKVKKKKCKIAYRRITILIVEHTCIHIVS
jgi:Ca2+/H+ antiporter